MNPTAPASSTKQSAAWFLLPLLYFPVRFFVGRLAGDYLLDDAYITLRYVQNVLDAGVLQYNVGESIFGITTILFPFLLIVLSKMFFFIELTTLVALLNITFECVTFVVLYKILRHSNIERAIAILIALLITSNGMYLISSQGGMETPLFCLLILLTILLVEKHIVAASLLAGAALFVRPEGLLLMAILFCINLVRPRNKIAFFIPIVAGLLYMAFFYFGYDSIIPASVEAKRAFPKHEPLRAGTYMLRSFHGLAPNAKIPHLLQFIATATIMLYGILRWPKKNAPFAVLILFPLLIILLYTAANPHMWFWYTVPMTTCVGIFFFYGLVQLLGKITPKKRAFATALCIALIAINLRWAFFLDDGLLNRYTDRVGEYAKLVQTLEVDHQLTRDKSILTHEIGAIGYYSRSIIYDAVGLTNPKLAPLGLAEDEGRMSHGRCTTRNIEKCNPDFIIFQDTLFEEGLLESESFQSNYTFLFEVENTSIPDLTGNLLVYTLRH